MTPQDYISNELKKVLDSLGFDTQDNRLFALEIPKAENHGDLASTVPLSLAKLAKQPPRKIAETIVEKFNVDPFYVKQIEIAGPGFINFHLAESCLQQAILDILEQGSQYGVSNAGRGERIQLEFVSANPTGPLNVVSARAASVGDVLANLLNAAGYDVEREFYVNDAGRQINLLGQSLSARYMAELGEDTAVPEEGYHGEYLVDLARDIIRKEGDVYRELGDKERAKRFSQKALETMIARHQTSMSTFRVNYDVWFRESSLRKKEAHLNVLERLKSAGYTYERDDAVWFQSSEFGDEKDRVLITSDKRPTYFLIDIAYHEDKFSRGFDRLIDFWGPDHHGYIARMSAALQALGHPKDKFQVSIIQQVNLLRDGQPVKMSKRAGEIIEMDELLAEVGVDASRYFFVNRRVSQHLDFDIELAKKQTADNPVWYVQYAHARTCNIFKMAQEKGYSTEHLSDSSHLKEDLAFAVVKKLLEFPQILVQAAETLEPHRLPNYLTDVAGAMHRFYQAHRVLTEENTIRESRLLLTDATRQVLANGLALMGITAPTFM